MNAFLHNRDLHIHEGTHRIPSTCIFKDTCLLIKKYFFYKLLDTVLCSGGKNMHAFVSLSRNSYGGTKIIQWNYILENKLTVLAVQELPFLLSVAHYQRTTNSLSSHLVLFSFSKFPKFLFLGLFHEIAVIKPAFHQQNQLVRLVLSHSCLRKYQSCSGCLAWQFKYQLRHPCLLSEDAWAWDPAPAPAVMAQVTELLPPMQETWVALLVATSFNLEQSQLLTVTGE